METTIRDVASGDLDAVLELNEANVPELGSATPEQMAWFIEHAPYFRVVDFDERIGALLVGL
ncbi:MAG: GNAT family N-acetyltransferase, partial [Pseudomonadota bacterium]